MTDINISDEKRNELQQLLVGEGYMPDEAREMAYSEDVKPEYFNKMLESLRGDAVKYNRRRWVKPADGAVDFIAEQNRRDRAVIDAECEAKQAQFDKVEDQLIAIATASGMSDIAITTCMLSALIQVLKGHDDATTLKEIKTNIAASLRVFFDKRIGDSESVKS